MSLPTNHFPGPGAGVAPAAAERPASDRAAERPTRHRIVVADDHGPMLATLVGLLSPEFDVVAAVTDGLAAVAETAKLNPDLLVLDIAMPGLNGIAAAARIRAHGSEARIVFVTNMRDREFVDESRRLGDVGFVIKDRVASDLLPAIHCVLAGQAFVSPTLAP
jgi:DNA-binding NarL/FixJ family response regulator